MNADNFLKSFDAEALYKDLLSKESDAKLLKVEKA